MTACVGTQTAPTTQPAATSAPPESSVPGTAVSTSAAPSSGVTDVTGIDTGDIAGFGVIEADLSGDRLVLAVADDSSLRGRGLMGVSDFGDVDGMIFMWGGDVVTSQFTMRDTLIPLTIAFFDADGTLVDSFDMVPCTADPCPPYAAVGPYAYAIEFEQGHVVPTDAELGLGGD